MEGYGQDNRQHSSYPPQHGGLQQSGYPAYPQQGQHGGPQDERGLGATLVGGGAAGWAAHAAGGGALGTIGGAVAGAIGANLLENKFEKKHKKHKKEKKEKKHHKRRGSGSSSSSSSSDSD
ncbi:hypothetical protein HYQ44_017052 [Verticillium longisporum]|nr:hypothetical protein HYQ44_017052 [Verticillium longisporum]